MKIRKPRKQHERPSYERLLMTLVCTPKVMRDRRARRLKDARRSFQREEW